MLLDVNRTVRELALEIPNATRVFERLNIDYCCGGEQSVGEACRRARVSVDEVGRWLDAAKTALPPGEEPRDFQSQPLADLITRIIARHHSFTRTECERLTSLLSKVCAAHGNNHPELIQIQKSFEGLRAELEAHMLTEERVLFPFVFQLEAAAVDFLPAPTPPFGTVRNPVAMMMREHDAAGEILREIRQLSSDFLVPTDACMSYETLYRALHEFEADLHQHIHLENNILFPRAIELESRAGI